MHWIAPYHEILTPISEGGIQELKLIELAARTCYKSEKFITEDGESAKNLISSLIKHGHEAMLEHSMLTVKFVVDRAIANEIVRHRIASYAQESTRWCNYNTSRFDHEIAIINPWDWIPDDKQTYIRLMDFYEEVEKLYMDLVADGVPAQEARAVLPLGLKTELVMTANYREWRHFLKLRIASDAHPQIRLVSNMLLKELKEKIPVVFDDLEVKEV